MVVTSETYSINYLPFSTDFTDVTNVGYALGLGLGRVC